jgi:hypothetical protein
LQHDELVLQLYGLLNTDDAEIPMSLRRAFMHLMAMATAAGFESLVDAAREHGEERFAQRAGLCTHAELAAEAYLRLPHVFQTARGRIRAHAPQRLHEYLPHTLDAVSEAQVRDRLERLRELLREYFLSKTGSGYCEILAARTRHDHDLLVCHAGCPTATMYITSEQRRQIARGWSEVRDVVAIDRHTGRLALCVESPADREHYRRAVGEALFDEAERYTDGPIYTGAPLLELGERALRVDGIEGLGRVDAVELRLRRKGARTDRVWLHPEPGWLASPEWSRAKLRSEVTYLRLAFHVEGRAYPAEVELVPPNGIALDRRVIAHYAYLFLARRGFMLRASGRLPIAHA